MIDDPTRVVSAPISTRLLPKEMDGKKLVLAMVVLVAMEVVSIVRGMNRE